MNSNNKFNPTPISKFLITIYLAFNIIQNINPLYEIAIVAFIALFFALNNRVNTAFKIIVFYGMMLALIEYGKFLDFKFIKDYILMFIIFLKIFFLPILAGKFTIATSDVSSLIVSFEKMRFPRVIIIPLAVMFRYFPAFKDDKKNIKMAMKMRGINFRNPFKYLEYVSVPLLISASNIADDISKAAETKCIADPCEKTRYAEVKFSYIDGVYLLGVLVLHILGRVYA